MRLMVLVEAEGSHAISALVLMWVGTAMSPGLEGKCT